MPDKSEKELISSPLRRLWLEWRGLIIFLTVMVLFRSAIADWNQVPSGSMKPTILEGDRVVVNKLAYDLKVPFTTWHLGEWGDPERGEIVTFYSPDAEKLLTEARQTNDMALRAKNYDEITKIWIAASPKVYLFEDKMISILSKRVDKYHFAHEMDFKTWSLKK